MNEENLIFIDRLIKDNPDYFKQEIIDHCRKMNNYEVYEWVANDEIKIQQLHKEKGQLQNNWNELKNWLEEEYEHCDKIGNPAIGCAMGQIRRIKSKMQELEGKSE